MASVNPYAVFGTETAELLGRRDLLRRIIGRASGKTPQPTSLIGPRYIGKSVLITHLAEKVIPTSERLLGSVYWDLGRHTPSNDQELTLQLAQKLQLSLRGHRSDLADLMQLDTADPKGEIDGVLATLAAEDVKVAILMDGFDRILSNASITRAQWDNMRDFAERGLVFVTGSRRPLQDLCESEESRTSTFWEIFGVPFEVGPFDQSEEGDIISPFSARGITFDKGALTELWNWTGGAPILVAAVLEPIFGEMEGGGVVSKNHVDEVAETIVSNPSGLLQTLWSDCSREEQLSLITLTHGPLLLAQIPHTKRSRLATRGYATIGADKVSSSCRMMERQAKRMVGTVEGTKMLFGKEEDFVRNTPSVLQHRLDQITPIDESLHAKVNIAIQLIASDPEASLGDIRRITQLAIDLCLKRELPDGKIPVEWVAKWKTAFLVGNNEIADGKIPRKDGLRCHLLKLMAGTDLTPRFAQKLTRTTILLIDHLQTLGDFGQHTDGNVISRPFALSACYAAVEMCASLSADFA